MNRTWIATGVLALALSGFALNRASLGDESEAVKRAVLDYVEAIEQGKPELIERSVHPDLAKFGFYREEAGGEYKVYPMEYGGLVELAGKMKAAGHVPDDATHEVELMDVMDKTAAAKLTAFWGIDYMHLAKHEDKWKIVHVLWQSRPEVATRTDG